MSIAIFQDVILAAGQSVTHSATGNSIVCPAATGQFKLSVNGGVASLFEPGFHWSPFPKRHDGSYVDNVRQVDVFNDSAIALTYTLAIAIGELVTRALTFAGGAVNVKSVGGALRSEPDLSVAAASQVLVAAATGGQRYAILSNLLSSPGELRIGDSAAAAAEGIPIQPGQSVTLETVDAIYAYNPHATLACTLSRCFIA